jgi:AcrR family transcriptional regulator
VSIKEIDMEDRRIKKTEKAIQIAFAKLLSDNSMGTLTVKKLCEIADINKSTFYLHYKDINDCADHLRDTIVEEFTNIIAPNNGSSSYLIENFSAIMENISELFSKNKDLYIPFFKSPSIASCSSKIKQLVITKALERADYKVQANEIYRCSISFLISGIISMAEQSDFAQIDHKTILTLANKIQNGFSD